MKKHSILTSILIFVMCLSMTVGGTYAMFATESKVNVAITLGKVDVEAYLKGDIKLSSSYGYNLPETIANYNEETKQIEVSNMVPGDQIDFTISVINKSTVSAKYQVFVKIQGDDAVNGKFEVKALGKTITGAIDYEDPTWTDIEPSTDSEPFIDVPVSVALPTDDVMSFDGEEQGKNIAITFGVRAVQGNAYTGPDATVINIPTEYYPEFNDIAPLSFGDYPENATIEALYSFSAQETPEQAMAGEYKYWLCDFIIETDTYIDESQIGLMGMYSYEEIYQGGWMGFTNPVALNKDDQLPLLTYAATKLGFTDLFEYMLYPNICAINTFNCGLFKPEKSTIEAGTQVTVSLIMYNPFSAIKKFNPNININVENSSPKQVLQEINSYDGLMEYITDFSNYEWNEDMVRVASESYVFQ